jgi:multidrug efflux pump subunit AcrA (membrane-fusion protein)
VTLPREQKEHEQRLVQARIDHETYKVAARSDLRRAELELDKAKDAYEEAERKLAELKADRDALRVRAPVDGYAVPGAFQGSGWSDIDGMRRALEPGGRLKAHQVLYTIVKAGDVDVVTSVGEGDLTRVKVGQAVTVRPKIDETKALEGVVTEVMPVGQKGRYAVAVDLEETLPHLMPGMGCGLEIAVRHVEDALTVPAGAVRKGTVWVLEDGEAKARKVETGATADGRVEILSGLKEGERVLATPPEETK